MPPRQPANPPPTCLGIQRLQLDHLQAPVLAVDQFCLAKTLHRMQLIHLQALEVSLWRQGLAQRLHHPKPSLASILEPASLWKLLEQHLLLLSLPVYLDLHQALVPLMFSAIRDRLSPTEEISSTLTKARTRGRPSPLHHSNPSQKRQRIRICFLVSVANLPPRRPLHRHQALLRMPSVSLTQIRPNRQQVILYHHQRQHQALSVSSAARLKVRGHLHPLPLLPPTVCFPT